MTEKLIFLSYLASMYPVGTRFAARLIARQKRHVLEHDRYSSRDIGHDDRIVSIVFGYAGGVVWPLTLVGVGVTKVAIAAGKQVSKLGNPYIDKHVAKIEGREEITLGKLRQR